MSYTILVLPEATQEVAEIYAYYEERRKGLGERFIEALNECYRSLERIPALQKRRSHFRHVVIRKFPYRVVFEVQDDSDRLPGQAHQSEATQKIWTLR